MIDSVLWRAAYTAHSTWGIGWIDGEEDKSCVDEEALNHFGRWRLLMQRRGHGGLGGGGGGMES